MCWTNHILSCAVQMAWLIGKDCLDKAAKRLLLINIMFCTLLVTQLLAFAHSYIRAYAIAFLTPVSALC